MKPNFFETLFLNSNELNPRSMNVSLQIKKTVRLLLPILVWLLIVPGVQHAQGGLSHHFFDIVTGDSVVITFDHHHVAIYPQIKTSNLPDNGFARFNPHRPGYTRMGVRASNNQPAFNTVIYTPDSGFYGYDSFIIDYYDEGAFGFPVMASMYIEVLVRPSSLIAEDDFASTNSGQAVTIDVLDNDFSNASIISVEALPVTNFGSVVLNSDTTITFTPDAGFSGTAKFNYTACDNGGSCDLATVSVHVEPNNPPSDEYLHIFAKENFSQVILLSLDGFDVTTPPQNGDLDSLDIMEYIPDANFVGSDTIVFTHPSSQDTKTIYVEVLAADEANIFVFDDIAFMPIDGGEVIINVVENDKGGTALNPVKTANPSNGTASPIGGGEFRYIPDAGFVGIDQFEYRVTTGGETEYGIVTVVVFDHEPELPVYNLITPKETPLVLNYNIPIEDFDFINFSQNLQYGTLDYYPGHETVVTEYGQEVSGYNMVIYTPNENEVGVTDEFEFEYCVSGNNNDCKEIKVIVDIVDVSINLDTLCAGNECVWAGDANHDGLVDIRDLLPIGLCMGEIGEERPNAALEWYGQYSENWNNPFAQMVMDIKHIDTDGDGTVEALDTAAISEFYYKRHAVTPEPYFEATDTLLFIEDIEFDPDTVEIGDVFIANINLGTAAQPAIDAYGVAFSLNYDPAIFEVSVSFENDEWLDYNSPMIGMSKQPFPDRIDAGYTRTTGVSGSGYGIIGKVEFIISDDLNGFRPKDNKTTISLTPLGMMNSSGGTVNTGGNSITLYLDTDTEEEENENGLNLTSQDKLKVYPNPASDLVNVHLNGRDNLMERVVVYTVTGQEVYDSGAVQTKRTQVDVGNLERGMYLLKVWTNGGMLNQKIEVIR